MKQCSYCGTEFKPSQNFCSACGKGDTPQQTPVYQPKKLTKDISNKVISGVCSGIGNYYDMDPTIVRILFVIFTMMGGSGILLYIILAIIIPNPIYPDPNKQQY